MATVKPLDPIQGFVDYINDIKPYHTKIAEVLIEYQQVELVDITIIEDLQFVIDMFRPDDRVLDGVVCPGGYDTFPYGGTSADVVTDVDPVTDTFTILGNRAPAYPPGSEIFVFSQTIHAPLPVIIADQDEADYDGIGDNGTFVGGNGLVATPYAPADTITLNDGSVITVDAADGNGDVTQFTVTTSGVTSVTPGIPLTQTSTSGVGVAFTLTPEANNVTNIIDPDGLHFGVFTVLSSTFVPGVNPFTTITVVEDIVDPIPILIPPFYYEINIQPAPIDIVTEIPYSDIDDRPFETPDENQVLNIGSNAFVIDGDFSTRFIQGVPFRVNTGKNVGIYVTLYSDYIAGDDQTRIRVIKDIKHISSIKGSPGGGQIKEVNLGYEPLAAFCPSSPENIAVVPLDSFVVDSVAFDWGATYFFDIIAVDDVLETILLDGDFASILFPGDEVFIVGSDVNNGTYNIVTVTLNMLTNETTVELDGDLDPSVTLGQLRIDLADIVDWFQYNIVTTNMNEFILYGNATADLFPSQQFRVLGNASNNGMYTALNVIYDGIHSTVVVADTLVPDVPGGVVESHRDLGMRLDYTDALDVTMVEEEVTALVASGLTYGGWDADYWDVGAYDENLGVLLLLYGGTF